MSTKQICARSSRRLPETRSFGLPKSLCSSGERGEGGQGVYCGIAGKRTFHSTAPPKNKMVTKERLLSTPPGGKKKGKTKGAGGRRERGGWSTRPIRLRPERRSSAVCTLNYFFISLQVPSGACGLGACAASRSIRCAYKILPRRLRCLERAVSQLLCNSCGFVISSGLTNIEFDCFADRTPLLFSGPDDAKLQIRDPAVSPIKLMGGST